jgi:hypothetical protein
MGHTLRLSASRVSALGDCPEPCAFRVGRRHGRFWADAMTRAAGSEDGPVLHEAIANLPTDPVIHHGERGLT